MQYKNEHKIYVKSYEGKFVHFFGCKLATEMYNHKNKNLSILHCLILCCYSYFLFLHPPTTTFLHEGMWASEQVIPNR